jgi:hypothetical protein
MGLVVFLYSQSLWQVGEKLEHYSVEQNRIGHIK